MSDFTRLRAFKGHDDVVNSVDVSYINQSLASSSLQRMVLRMKRLSRALKRGDTTSPFGGAWGRRGATPGHLQGVFLLGGPFIQGDSENVMFLESMLLSVQPAGGI